MVWTRRVLRWLFAALFVAAGVNHFVNPDFYVGIMPPYLPWHLALVYLSGVAEVALGFALLVPAVSRLAAWGLIALLVAVSPANLHMALNPGDYPSIAPWVLYARLPVQALLVAWAYWLTRSDTGAAQES